MYVYVLKKERERGVKLGKQKKKKEMTNAGFGDVSLESVRYSKTLIISKHVFLVIRTGPQTFTPHFSGINHWETRLHSFYSFPHYSLIIPLALSLLHIISMIHLCLCFMFVAVTSSFQFYVATISSYHDCFLSL